MSNTLPASRKRPVTLPRALTYSAKAWFVTAALGQLAFIAFIVGFYGQHTVRGNFAAWNNKPLIDGYTPADPVGNWMFAVHVTIAAVMTLSGLMQLLPQLRKHAPGLHRASGRVFLVTACSLAIGGLWLVWGRGTQLSVVSAVAISLNAVLILVFATLAFRTALRRKIASHQRWAMRLFMVANGVWFLRVFLMAWITLAGGVGMNRTLSGPVDIILVFGCFLLPLATYELYWRATRVSSKLVQWSALTVVSLASPITAIGALGALSRLWLPYL